MATINDIPEPLDATHIRDWQLDGDGYGRWFRGSVHGTVRIYGYQHQDGRVERSIHLDVREWHNLVAARSAVEDLQMAISEITGMEKLEAAR